MMIRRAISARLCGEEQDDATREAAAAVKEAIRSAMKVSADAAQVAAGKVGAVDDAGAAGAAGAAAASGAAHGDLAAAADAATADAEHAAEDATAAADDDAPALPEHWLGLTPVPFACSIIRRFIPDTSCIISQFNMSRVRP
jgi:hypothetical protein